MNKNIADLKAAGLLDPVDLAFEQLQMETPEEMEKADEDD